jgi:predicted unusual protein kinase regulating ubiquinone biosynthesis (AarF/ABC1/UbiB family)
MDTTVGLRQMARLGVHQWDLNAGNVLVKRLASNGRIVAKICDFGFCRRAEEHEQLTSLSLVGHATTKTDYTPHIHATVMSTEDDMEAIAVRAVGFLMGFVAFPMGTHHSEYTSKNVTRHVVNGWDTFHFRKFASIMRGCIHGDINTLNTLHQRLTEFFF